jgi:hypothetical protein
LISTLPTSSSRFEFCKEYCNNNDECLGFLTDPGNPDYTGELMMVQCYITKELTYMYNNGLNKVESCQKKIVESCRAAPTLNPTAPPPTPAPTDTIQDCRSCLDVDFTWCEARLSIYNSEPRAFLPILQFGSGQCSLFGYSSLWHLLCARVVDACWKRTKMQLKEGLLIPIPETLTMLVVMLMPPFFTNGKSSRATEH